MHLTKNQPQRTLFSPCQLRENLHDKIKEKEKKGGGDFAAYQISSPLQVLECKVKEIKEN